MLIIFDSANLVMRENETLWDYECLNRVIWDIKILAMFFEHGIGPFSLGVYYFRDL